ncbi:MAG TPA: Gfo/Idh/MocA family oxidoreductase [Candidatus Acidoferrum sp.]|jgi:predicted dehydrogenase|nr:Gfo/Idh/MocA family oxidoreductase [Candidatus Acidoferrum sp.]
MKPPTLSRERFVSSLSIALLFLLATSAAFASPRAKSADSKTRLAIIGLDHDHVWGLIQDLAAEPNAELVAIADARPALVNQAKPKVSTGVKFYSDYVQMLDEAKPEVVIVTTENDRHLEILRECAKRHIHYSTEKPMATNAADAREMERLANQAGIKVMVNYWNAWVAPTHDLFHRVRAGQVGAVQKIIVQYGHAGPKEIGVSQYFADWLYDPIKNGGGAIMDFGCYGAEWALWLKGRPARVSAIAGKLKVEQHNKVDDDATIVLDYPDGTVIIEASWNWPYSMGQVQVFGPKGSLLATGKDLFFRPANDNGVKIGLEGERIALEAPARETSNPISYFVDCIRNDKPIEDPLSTKLNVQVMEILDAARESIRTGKQQELH